MSLQTLAEREVNIRNIDLSRILRSDVFEEPNPPAVQTPAPVNELIIVPDRPQLLIYPSGSFTTGTSNNIIVSTNCTNQTSTTPNVIVHGYCGTSTSTTTAINMFNTNNVIIYSSDNTVFYSISSNAVTGYYTNNRIQPGKYRKERHTVKKTVKNSIKRALKLLDNFGMEDDTKIFLSGKDIEVSHPDSMFKFVITKRSYNNIISATECPIRSVPFRLELFTKTGVHVANLCVYAEDSPMLDQLFMVAMYVKSGNEEDLLRKANFFSISSDIELKESIVGEIDYLKPKLLK